MDIAESRRDGIVVITPGGRIDSTTASNFDKHVSAVIDRGDTSIVVDMSQLDYISSMGLSVFLSAAKKIKAADGRLALAGFNNRVRLVFEMTGFLQLFQVYPTLEAALADTS